MQAACISYPDVGITVYRPIHLYRPINNMRYIYDP